MSTGTTERIAFDVQTDRILQILSSEIYDSPKAFLRENVQNAYDAVLMRCTAQSLPISERRIDITVAPNTLTVIDDGIGMTEHVLRENFWKAGSSGKRSELALRSGVIGTFGIGAMANFGVCTELRVETRHINSEVSLISSAVRSELKIAKDCVSLDRVADNRGPGTTIVARLDPSFAVDEPSAAGYLRQYVRFVDVPIFLNGKLISQETFDSAFGSSVAGFKEISNRRVSRGNYAANLQVMATAQGRVLVKLSAIEVSGTRLLGEALLVERGGQTFGYRNRFGLAPVPISGAFELGGFINLSILHPTAGREALSRESIQQISELVAIVEEEMSKDIAETETADQNQHFQQYIHSRGAITLAKNLTITVLPKRVEDVTLASTATYEESKKKHFYTGTDATILKRFATDEANLFHVSQAQPRRSLQHRYLQEVSRVPEIPEKVIVDRINNTQLSVDEAVFLVKLRGILLSDYFLPNVDVAFATISHGVAIQSEQAGETLKLSIARSMPAARMVLESYRSAPEVFHGFVIDFIRQHLYPQIREHVPSSTQQGRDALYRRLKENEELFRLDRSEFGAIEPLLADYLAGKADLEQVLRSSSSMASGQRQEVRREQVGTVEQEMPGIIAQPADGSGAQTSDTASGNTDELVAAPPIVRREISSSMKVLTVAATHKRLNGFQMFLAISDRLARTEGEYLNQPHTTKVMWGSHRIIYVFGNPTGDLSLYYDIKLKEPLGIETTGGAMFPTTTIVTADRIYVPVPNVLEPAFRITNGAKEFFVRFDTIP